MAQLRMASWKYCNGQEVMRDVNGMKQYAAMQLTMVICTCYNGLGLMVVNGMPIHVLMQL